MTFAEAVLEAERGGAIKRISSSTTGVLAFSDGVLKRKGKVVTILTTRPGGRMTTNPLFYDDLIATDWIAVTAR